MFAENLYHQPYYELVSSLPDLVLPLPVYKNIPLTDEELNSRLTMLEEKDKNEVIKAANFIIKSELNEDDAPIMEEFQMVLNEITHSGVKELLKGNMRLKTIKKALILSCEGKKLPPLEDGVDNWGYDAELMAHIRTNWNSPYFSLTLDYPDIIHIKKMMLENKVGKFIDWMDHALWSHYIDLNDNYEFSLENVAIFMVQRAMVKNKLTRNTNKTIEIIKDAVTNMIDKMELNL